MRKTLLLLILSATTFASAQVKEIEVANVTTALGNMLEYIDYTEIDNDYARYPVSTSYQLFLDGNIFTDGNSVRYTTIGTPFDDVFDREYTRATEVNIDGDNIGAVNLINHSFQAVNPGTFAWNQTLHLTLESEGYVVSASNNERFVYNKGNDQIYVYRTVAQQNPHFISLQGNTVVYPTSESVSVTFSFGSSSIQVGPNLGDAIDALRPDTDCVDTAEEAAEYLEGIGGWVRSSASNIVSFFTADGKEASLVNDEWIIHHGLNMVGRDACLDNLMSLLE